MPELDAAGSARRRVTFSRRRVVTAGGAALSLAAVAGCGGRQHPAASETGGPAATRPARGGSLAVSHDFNRGIDPHVNQAQDSGIMGLFYQTLLRFNATTYNLEPEIAAKWEVPTQTELVFSLAPNVKWHDKAPVNGRPLKVDDIIASYQRAGSEDPRYVNRSFLSSIQAMEAVDDRTLKLTLKQPDVTQLANLAIFSLAIMAPEAIEAAKGNLNTAEATVGTGPFVLTSTEPGVGSSLVRNSQTWSALSR